MDMKNWKKKERNLLFTMASVFLIRTSKYGMLLSA